MRVDPGYASTAGIERPSPEKKQHAVPNPWSADQANKSSGNNSKLEIARPRNISAPLAIPEHEVKVIIDAPGHDTLVYQVLDKQTGDVVLQVPSAEQLRGIHESQELLQQITARAAAPTSGEVSAPDAKVERTKNGSKF